jgi:hypothetical protein
MYLLMALLLAGRIQVQGVFQWQVGRADNNMCTCSRNNMSFAIIERLHIDPAMQGITTACQCMA